MGKHNVSGQYMGFPPLISRNRMCIKCREMNGWNICTGVFSGTRKKWLGHSSLWAYTPSNHQGHLIPDTAMKAGMQNVTCHENAGGKGGGM